MWTGMLFEQLALTGPKPLCAVGCTYDGLWRVPDDGHSLYSGEAGSGCVQGFISVALLLTRRSQVGHLYTASVSVSPIRTKIQPVGSTSGNFILFLERK